MKTLKRLGATFFAVVMTLSMTLPAMAAGQTSLPEPGKTGSITLHKYEIDNECLNKEEDGTELPGDTVVDLKGQTLNDLEGLANIGFSITKVTLKSGSTLGTTNVDDYEAVPGAFSEIKKTDADGIIKWDNLEQGYYLIREVENATAAKYVAPFIVSIPMTNPEGDGYLYDIHVYPKNQIKEGPDIEKEVVGSTEGSGSNMIDYRISTGIPEDIGTAKNYVVTDELDSRLIYDASSLKVYYLNRNGNTISLTSGVHYTPTFDAGLNKLVISITQAGMEEMAKAWSVTGATNPTLRVEFSAMISLDQSAPDWDTINNKGILDYTNSDDYTYEPKESEVPTEPYGIEIIKVDGDNNTLLLAGAKFKIYTSEADALSGENALTNPESGAGDWEVTTDNNGKAYFYGLTSGDYWIVETQAPKDSEGKTYNLLEGPLKITIDETLANETYPVEIVTVNNFTGFTLPLTGGTGTILFTLIGLMMLSAAGVLLIVARRRKVQ